MNGGPVTCRPLVHRPYHPNLSRDRFREAFAAEYEALDQACARLTSSERPLGTFALADSSQDAI